MHPIVELAKRAAEEYVRHGRVLEAPADPDGVLGRKAAVFVCVKTAGHLRGCIGTMAPMTENAAQETIRNAVAAVAEDPRFFPVGEAELRELEFTVDVLSTPEIVQSAWHLDTRRYGVIVSKGGRRGVLLPDIEGVDTVEKQLEIAMTKAGIDPGEEGMTIERFEVERYR
ncbi:MAG: AmmeMemoRadiSam system protein A [Nitrospirota bacterium]